MNRFPVLRRVLLFIWRWFPLPAWLRSHYLWWTNARFLVGASALIFDPSGNVLVIRHTYRPTHPWGLPGGWLHGDETPESAVVREVREEIGLDVHVTTLAGAGRTENPRHIHLAYAAEIAGGEFRRSPEATEMMYVPPAELYVLLMPEDRWIVPIIERLSRQRVAHGCTASDRSV